MFRIQNLECPIADIGDKRWTLDEDEDFRFITLVYEHFSRHKIDNFSTENILEFLSENPELETINSMHLRDEGLKRSLEHDYIVDSDH